MVVFTCNNCGDSVNKPKVEKHIQYECKRKHFAVSFCCVDCLKDFNYETVKEHCQCVTEEQRYSAKGFVAKPSAEKGKRKQAGWVDIVQSVIDRKDIPNDERQFLNVIAKYDNVPRKKNKFQNFCFSSAPAYRKKGYLVDKVFDMIEAEYKAQQIIQNSDEKPSTNNVESLNNSDNLKKSDITQEKAIKDDKTKKNVDKKKKINNEITTIDEITEEISNKLKKKNKKSLDALNIEVENKSAENLEPHSEKKKKKEKKLQEDTVTTKENYEKKDENTIEVQPESAKKSKKKRKPESNGSNEVVENDISKSENINQENGITTGENGILQEKSEIQLSKKEKKEMKKKMKYQNELTTVTNDVSDVGNQPISKKKKRKLSDNEENEEPQQKLLKTVTEKTPLVPEVQLGRKFEWNVAINQVLQKKKNKPMSISKVMKRVMNEYHSLNETTKKSESKLEKIFLKKLKKLKNVVITNDKVQIIECY